jgi:vacuolar-type H+-ATPase subunit E/Vma4
MPLADLLEALKAEAADEMLRHEAESRAEAAKILQSARRDEQQLVEDIVREREPRLQADADRIRSQARLEAARSADDGTEQNVRETLDAARFQLATVRDRPDYRSVLRELIREGRSALPSATLIRVDPRDERLTAELSEEMGLALRITPSLETAGGLELEAPDGRTLCNTLEERLENAEPILRLRLRELVAEALAGRADRIPAGLARDTYTVTRGAA